MVSVPKLKSYSSGLPGHKWQSDLGATHYLVAKHFQKEEYIEYNPKNIPIGLSPEGEIVSMDFSKPKHTLIIAKTGSGKSVIEQAMITRAYMAGIPSIVMSDTKGEYIQMNKPLQSKYYHFLMKDSYGNRVEQPQPMPLHSYYSAFLQKETGRSFPTCDLMQFPLNELKLSEIYTLLGEDDPSDYLKLTLNEIWEKVTAGDVNSFNQFKDEVMKMNDITEKQKNKIISMIKNLFTNQTIGDDFEPISFADDINNNLIPVLNLAGYDSSGSVAGINYAKTILSIALRRFRAEKESEKIPMNTHVMLHIDELKRLASKDSSSPAKEVIIDSIETIRSWNVSMVFSSQNLRIPDEIIKNVRYIIIAGTHDFDELLTIVKSKMPSLFTNHQTLRSDMAELFGDLKRHWFIIFDTELQEFQIVKSFMPLSYHYTKS